MICRLALVAGGNTSVYTPYLETWFEDGRSIRSSNQVRWEDTNDSERHPLHQKVLGTYEELIAHHSRLTTGAGPALAVVHAADYVRLRRAAYDDCFRSAMRRGLVRVRDDSYRFTARGCAQIVWRTFDLVGALATERVW